MTRFTPASFAAPIALAAIALLVACGPAAAVQFDGAAVRLGIAQGSIDMPHAPDPRDFIPENGPTGDFMGDSSEMGQMSQMGQTEEDEGPFDFLDEDTEHGAPVMAPAAQHAAGTFFDV